MPMQPAHKGYESGASRAIAGFAVRPPPNAPAAPPGLDKMGKAGWGPSPGICRLDRGMRGPHARHAPLWLGGPPAAFYIAKACVLQALHPCACLPCAPRPHRPGHFFCRAAPLPTWIAPCLPRMTGMRQQGFCPSGAPNKLKNAYSPLAGVPVRWNRKPNTKRPCSTSAYHKAKETI